MLSCTGLNSKIVFLQLSAFFHRLLWPMMLSVLKLNIPSAPITAANLN